MKLNLIKLNFTAAKKISALQFLHADIFYVLCKIDAVNMAALFHSAAFQTY